MKRVDIVTTLRSSLIVLCLLCSAILYSQVYHEVFTSRDGLSIDYVEDIVQDDFGFLWISGSRLDNREIIAKSSPVSLQRFDGKNFHNFNIQFQKKPIQVSKMLPYRDSLLLLYSKNDNIDVIVEFNPNSTNYQHIENNDFENVANVRKVEDHYYLLNATGTKIDVSHFNEDHTVGSLFSFENEVNVINIDRNTQFIAFKDLFIFSDKYFPIVITGRDGVEVKRFSNKNFNRARNLISNKLWIEQHFIHDNELYAFMGNDDRLYKFNKNTLRFEVIIDGYFVGKTALKTFKDSSGNLVIAYISNDRLNLVTIDNEEVVPIHSHTVNNSTTIQLWSQNVKNELWLATKNEIHYYKFSNNQFEKFLLDHQMRAIKRIEDENYLIATEDGGWYSYNHLSKKVMKFPVFENGKEIILNSSRNIIVDKDTLWSHSSGNMVAIHRKTGNTISYRDYPVQCLEQLNDSVIVSGTKHYNLMSFNIASRTFEALVKTDSLNHIDLSIDQDKEWIVTATQQGIFKYNLKDKTSSLISTGLKDNYFLVSDYFNDYGFLLGTRDGNIVKFNPQDDTVSIIYEDTLNAGIATIIPYENDLWISTFNGLVHFDPMLQKSTRYSIKDGLSHNEGNRYSASYTSNGILAGSLSGINHFVPQDLVAQQSRDSLSLLKIRKFNPKLNSFVDVYDKSAFAKAKTIKLPVENKQLELEYSLTGLDVLRNESYEYRLDDNDWVTLGDKKKLQFLNLASGEYDLELRARDFSGELIGKPLLLKINSEDFFYKKWWFIVLISLTIITLLVYFLKQEKLKKLMQVQFSQDLIEKQELERSRIAKELHDSVGQQLTLIKQTAQNEELNHISVLTNSTLEEVRSISRNLYPANLHRLGFKASVEQLLEDIDEQTDMFIDLEIENIDRFLDQRATLNLYRFIQEAVSNVIKHARSKTLQIHITSETNVINVSIIDKGTGFKNSTELMKNSLGLKTLEERIKIINGNLEILSVIGKGTELKSTIPKSKS